MSPQRPSGTPTGPRSSTRRHVTVFVIGIPVTAAAGVAASLIDAVGALAAGALPVVVFVSVLGTRLVVFRTVRWLWALITAVAWRLR